MFAELVPAFSIGLLATLSPCALPLYPGFLAYLAAGAADRPSPFARWLGVFVLAGVLVAMIGLGGLIAVLSVGVGQVLVFLTPLADIVVIGLGTALLLGANPFRRLPVIAVGPVRGGAALSAFVYGLLYGPIALPCSGALFVGILTLSLAVMSFLDKLLFFVAFGLGFGLPLLVLSLLASSSRTALLRTFVRHERAVTRVAGAILVGIGAWDFAANLPFVLLYLGA